MGNLLDYLKEYHDRDFLQSPFCEVDAVILAQLSYLDFDGVVPSWQEDKEPVALPEIQKRMDPEKVFFFRTYEQQNRKLWELLLSGKRFRDMRCNFYCSRLDWGEEMQFAAVTFFLPKEKPVVAFRGTDGTIVGWKEDFNMTFQPHVPAQEMSARYLDAIGPRLGESFRICGHSKGGNLAVYSATMANGDVQERIRCVYSLDGPGFLPEILPEDAYGRIRGRIRRILPVSSLVGMLLQNYERYEVVQSTAFGVLQHDCYTWKVEKNGLLRAPDIEAKQKRMDEVLNQWIFALPQKEREMLVNSLFEMLEGTGAKTLAEFSEDWKKNLRFCLTYMRDLDPDTHRRFRRLVKMLFEIYGSVTQDAIRREFSR